MLCLWDAQELSVQDRGQAKDTKTSMTPLSQDRALGHKKGGTTGPNGVCFSQRLLRRLGHPGNPSSPSDPPSPRQRAVPSGWLSRKPSTEVSATH